VSVIVPSPSWGYRPISVLYVYCLAPGVVLTLGEFAGAVRVVTFADQFGVIAGEAM